MNKLKILCPFCNACYTAKMLHELDISMMCDTCGGEVEGKIEIKCSNCERIVYAKAVDGGYN